MSHAHPEAALPAFVAALGGEVARAPDLVVRAFAAHLATLDAAKLPPAAQADWTRVTRLLKAPSTSPPIPPRAIATIASWPSARVADLLDTLHAIAAAVEQAANDRLIDETNSQVARAYL